MGVKYKVVDLRTDVIDAAGHEVEGAASPEAAARTVLGVEVVRSGARKDLVGRVYWQTGGQPMNMVRVYGKVAGPARE